MQKFSPLTRRLNFNQQSQKCCGNRLLSSISTEHSSNASTKSSLSKQEQHRRKILNASLTHVHEYGWTEEAIAQGVISAGFPPSYIGLVEDSQNKPLGLISFFMEESNTQLDEKVRSFCERRKKSGTVQPNRAEVMEFAIRARLEMVEHFIESKRWHEGMALGAMPSNAMSTTSQLEDLMDKIASAMTNADPGTRVTDLHAESRPLGQLERAAIGSVYIATELHMLADTSDGFEETWSFLKDRVQEMEVMAAKQSSSGLPSLEMAAAASMVASSMGGAFLSLFAPTAKMSMNSMAGTVIPNVMDIIQQQQQAWDMGDRNGNAKAYATSSKDFDDLPPFENSNDFLKK